MRKDQSDRETTSSIWMNTLNKETLTKDRLKESLKIHYKPNKNMKILNPHPQNNHNKGPSNQFNRLKVPISK